MGRFRKALATATVGMAMAAHSASAQDEASLAPPPISAPLPPSDTSGGVEPQPLPKPKPPAPKPEAKPAPARPAPAKRKPKPKAKAKAKPKVDSEPAPEPFDIGIANATCGPGSIPSGLAPLYRAASRRYGLGPSGPALLAAINEIESGFGANNGPSSAGAIGPMQFMPSTWVRYGVDADGDGEASPWDTEDAIFAAARYLRASGMPEDPYSAIFAYNHADWYVADVLARARCFGATQGLFQAPILAGEIQALSCEPPGEVRGRLPEEYLAAFQRAASRYELGEAGVWAMAGVARLESNFGTGLRPRELRRTGPLRIEPSEWRRYAVDGDGDGKIVRRSPEDSAATMARMMWAAGSVEKGLFEHNHAGWYVDAVLTEAAEFDGKCTTKTVDFAVSIPDIALSAANINWDNVVFSNPTQLADIRSGLVDPRLLAVIGAISQQHEVTITSLRSDHGQYTTSGSISNHFFGRAVDIGAIDGVPCTVTTPTGPCGRIAAAVASMPIEQRPTEIIFCFDVDGPGPAFAAADHCDHVHLGFDY